MGNKLTLVQQQRMQMRLSPAQIQVMRMLELPACELQARINEELQANPALEEGKEETDEQGYTDLEGQEGEYENPLKNEDFDYDDYVQDDDMRETQGSSGRQHEDIPFSMGMSFSEYLKGQIYLTKMNKADRHIAKFVVGNIDDDGYLRRTVEELVDDLSFREGLVVSEDKMQEIVDAVKEFDPVGVGAYDLQECLLIQLDRKEEVTSGVELAKKILTHYFDAFYRHQFDKIGQRLQVSEEELKEAMNEIVRLNPRPGNAWSGTLVDRNQSIVIPDFIVEQVDDDLVISLNNGNISDLHVSADYQRMLEEFSCPTSHNTSD